MRNLRIVALEEEKLPAGLPLTATAWDTSNDSIICAFGPTTTKPLIELKRRRAGEALKLSEINGLGTEFELITSWDASCPLPELACDEILSLQYFPDTSTACVVLAGGDLVVVREDPLPGQDKIEIVGSVDAGLAAAAWAQDEELLAMVTRANTLILMSRDFEPVTETTLTADDLNASKHVSVGWGKKETQFHGKRAKALRDPTMPEVVDEGELSQKDDGRTSISWRGDGAYVAVNNIVGENRRVIRVFTREGVLDSASEPVNGLESALSWKPLGNLIAGVQRLQGRIDVVFFERNGLRHGHFSLRPTMQEMNTWASSVSLSWNTDSTVLAICFRDRTQLWMMGNYHYYLKQEIPSPDVVLPKSPLLFRWHAEKALVHCISTSRSILRLEYNLTVCRSSTVQPSDMGAVSVIDGSMLKLTPLRYANVPPPMSFCEVDMEQNIVDCAFDETGDCIAILTNSTLEVVSWKKASTTTSHQDTQVTNDTSRPKPTSVVHRILRNDLKTNSSLRSNIRYTQIAFIGSRVYVLAPPQNGSPALLESVLVEGDQRKSTVPPVEEKPSLVEVSIPATTQRLLVDVHRTKLWSQDGERTISISDETLVSGTESPGHVLEGNQSNSEIFGPVLTTHGVDEKPPIHDRNNFHGFYKVSLNGRGELLVGKRVLARGCTSFGMTEKYLLFTTTQHLIKFVHLSAPDQMVVPGDTPELDERCRSIERGARLITIIPSTFAVVLQMPRGNLETIYPRLLVLSGVRQHVVRHEYLKAFLACQNHQVDMNILYDYRPEDFLANTSLFIQQLKNTGRIDEFLSKLKEEDTSKTLYKETLIDTAALDDRGTANLPTTVEVSSAPLELLDDESGKVNRICDAFLSTLATKGPSYLQNVVTAHVCKRPPDLIAGLELVASLRQRDQSQAESAIERLCFLSDTTRLFDAALGLYDLELALLVAQQSQRDPREYIPFVQKLHSLENIRRKFEIDNHLRRYPKALTSLYDLKAHEELRSFTIKHNLYTQALKLYQYEPSHLSEITHLYALHLSAQSRHSEAATVYESLGAFSSAYPAYALAHQWREALTCASLVPLGDTEMCRLAQSLATTCAEESRDYRSAATIHLDYLADVPGSARLLCKGSYFSEAARILSLHRLSAEMPQILESGLTEKFGEILELLADCRGQINAQVPRIVQVRQMKAEDPLAFYGGDAAAAVDGGPDIPDNISLAGTDASTVGGQSLFTRYGSSNSRFGGTVASNASRKTSKTRKREERKRARGKKGTVYEEEYLVGSVARLIERINGAQDEVHRLLQGLMRRSMRERAQAVNDAMVDMTALCQKARRHVWSAPVQEPSAEHGQYDVGGAERPSGADGVFWESQMDSQVKKDPPAVKAWKPPSFLDYSS